MRAVVSSLKGFPYFFVGTFIEANQTFKQKIAS